jgi:hypothetical protein
VGRRVGLALSIGLVAALVSPAARAGSPSSGCSPSRAAVAYDASGRPLRPQPPAAPAPCLVATGFATVETHIVVTADGSLVYEPAIITPGLLGSSFAPGAPGPHLWSPLSPAGVAVSRDRGATWRFAAPAGDLYSATDNAMYVDPATGRLFMAMLTPNIPSGGQLAVQDQVPLTHEIMLTSADDGATWDYEALPAFVSSENPRFTAAPPPTGGARPAGGYPDVTYWCGNRAVGLMEPLIIERECYRSLDAGTSWEMRSILFTSPVPRHRQCGTSREDIDSYDGNYPQGASDGSLYVMVGCTPNTTPTGHDAVDYLARSTDEAASFPVIRGPGSTAVTLPVPAGPDHPELRIAQVGGRDTFVLVYSQTGAGGPRLVMRTATIPGFMPGGGLAAPPAWSPPVRLTPPGLLSLDRWAVDVRGSELAASYLAGNRRPGSSSTVYDGYLSVTPDVGTVRRVWTAVVNDSSKPLSFSAPVSAKDDFIGVAIGPDGRPWASYFSPCSAEASAATDSACQGQHLSGRPVDSSIEGGEDRGLVASLSFRR